MATCADMLNVIIGQGVVPQDRGLIGGQVKTDRLGIWVCPCYSLDQKGRNLPTP